jgi:hypothetical protein
MRRLLVIALLLALACDARADMLQRGRGYRRGASSWDRSGLILEWLFATDANDTSGKGNNGTLTGNATVTGHSVYVDGADDSVTIADNTTFDAWTNTITVTAWIRPTVATPGSWSQILGKYDNPYEWILLYGVTANKPEFYVRIGATIHASGVGATTINTNAFQFVVGRKTATDIEVWLNNVKQNGKAQTGAIALSNSGLRAGALGGTSQEFTGYIDDCRVFNRALTTDEMTAMYNAGRSQ